MSGWRNWLAASALLFPTAARAQVIRGQVMDARDSVALSGILVQLVDARDAIVSRSLTNEQGQYRLIGAADGLHRLRLLRVGYRPVLGTPVLIEAGAEVTRDIMLVGVPISLDTVRVLARNLCNVPTDSATATFAIWEQARTALTAAMLTARGRPIGATLVTFDRVLDPDMRRIRQQRVVVRSGVSARPFKSISADSLRRFGYVTADADGWTTYNAPDLDVLLSTEFVEDHCFRLATSSDRTRIGIAFEPNPERHAKAEISGTLWIDRQSAELRRLDFRYANLSRPPADQAGGDVEFIRLRTGAWLISRWNIRMPVQRTRTHGFVPGLGTVSSARVFEVRVAGGELASVTRGRDTLWRHAPFFVSGTVQDSASRLPLAGAWVVLQGTQVVVLSDERGRFAIPNALPGEYVLEVRNASLDSLGLVHRVPVVVTDASIDVRVRLPSSRTLLATLCANAFADRLGASFGALVGTVHVRGDSVARGEVAVAVEWREFELRKMTQAKGMAVERTRGLVGRTDSTGVFRVCGVPVNTAVWVRTALDERPAAMTPARIAPQQRFANVRVVVDPPSSEPPPP